MDGFTHVTLPELNIQIHLTSGHMHLLACYCSTQLEAVRSASASTLSDRLRLRLLAADMHRRVSFAVVRSSSCSMNYEVTNALPANRARVGRRGSSGRCSRRAEQLVVDDAAHHGAPPAATLDAARIVDECAAVRRDVHSRDGDIGVPVREGRMAQVEQHPAGSAARPRRSEAGTCHARSQQRRHPSRVRNHRPALGCSRQCSLPCPHLLSLNVSKLQKGRNTPDLGLQGGSPASSSGLMADYNAGTPGTQRQRSRRAVDGCAQFESPTVRALNSSRPVQASVQAIELGKAALNSSRPPSEQPRADLRQRASRAGQRASRAATKCNTEHPSAQLLGEFHMDRPRFRGSLV